MYGINAYFNSKFTDTVAPARIHVLICSFFVLLQTNSYQAIIVSNVTSTYAIFSYMCGEIQWSALGVSEAAIVGLNSAGRTVYNHPTSGSNAIGDFVSCTFILQNRQKRQAEQNNNLMLQIPAEPTLTARIESCLAAYQADFLFFQFTPEYRRNISLLRDLLEPCPCSYYQALGNDYGRFIEQDGMPFCFVSANPVPVNVRVSQPLSLTQQCCYDP